MAEPRPVIALDYAPPSPRATIWRAIVRWTVPLSWLCCVVGTFAILVEVESVLVSGPVLFVLGLLTLIGGKMTGRRWVTGLGWGHVGICILYVGLVNLRGWSPSEAEAPFAVMSIVYTLATVAPSVMVFNKSDEGLVI